MAKETVHVATIVVDDRLDSAVEAGQVAHVRGGHPAEGAPVQPAALVEELVEHLVRVRVRVKG